MKCRWPNLYDSIVSLKQGDQIKVPQGLYNKPTSRSAPASIVNITPCEVIYFYDYDVLKIKYWHDKVDLQCNFKVLFTHTEIFTSSKYQ